MKDKIEQLHLTALNTYGLINVPAKSAQITEDVAIKFATWCDDRVLSDDNKEWVDWYNEFLKTLQI